ncbi:MAG: CHAT domain-containing protein [Deltaproteobacteria bacterium]|nr:CHAT domain-containing protein [Deltaproteobacteria bacterium]
MRRPVTALLALLLVLGLLGAAPAVDEAMREGDAAWTAGDLASALVSWSHALERAREAEDDDAIVEASLRLAAAHRELGRVRTAVTALDAAEASAADNPAAAARLLTARGQLALASGEPRRAERLLLQAFEAQRELQDPVGAANAAVDLGLARLALGHHEDARKAFTGAATLFELSGDRDGRADALTNLGVTDLRDGRLRAAQEHLEAALALYRATGNTAGEADATANLARVLQALGRDEAAFELYRSALATARARRDVPRQATLLLNLGTLAQRAGDIPGAEARYTAAEEAFVTAGRADEAVAVALNLASLRGDDPAAFARVLERAQEAGDRRVEAMASLDLAALLRTSDPKRARRYVGQASRIAEDLALSELRWRALYLSGRIALDKGDTRTGVGHLREAVEQLERTRRSLEEDAARGFVFGHQEVYEALIDALLAEGDSLGAFVYAERLQIAQLPDLPITEDAEELARYREMAAEESFVTDQLSAALVAHPDSEQAAALRERLAALRVAFATTVDELRAAHPDFDRLVRVDPEDLEAMQAGLEPGVVVLQPVLFEDRLVLLVFRHDRVVARTVDVRGEEVSGTISRLARSLRARLTTRPAWTLEVCEQLGAWLIDPIATDLEGAEILVVSASGPFRQLPFSLLRHDGAWLVEMLPVVGITHVGSLAGRSTLEGRFQVDGPGLLLIGNPDGTLPGAEEEVRAIARRFPGATVLLAEAGSPDAMREAAASKRVIHLATHGRIDPDRPDRSHLVLAGSEETGRLGYREIPGLAPYLGDCRLVVLSACESGLPVEAREEAAEGEVIVSINGLSAQFRRAGVETLVASLWQVDDASTRTLMVHFYERLGQGQDVAHALQDAQLELIRTEEWSHPWYWGAFVVMGDWR